MQEYAAISYSPHGPVVWNYFIVATTERAKARQDRAARSRVCEVAMQGCEVIVSARGEVCDGITNRIYDSDDFSNLAG